MLSELTPDKTVCRRIQSAGIQRVVGVGNVAPVARRHELSKNTLHGWISARQQASSVRSLSRSKDACISDLEKQLKTVSTESYRL